MPQRFPILVTGGAGYIGSHAVLALADADWPVVVLDNFSSGVRGLVDDRATLLEGDVGDMDLVEKILLRHDIGAIMHFAGSTIVEQSVCKPLSYYENNTANSRGLIAAAIRAGIHHFIFSSTAATYGSFGEGLVNEQTERRPINPYGMSKLLTEHMLADTAAAHRLNYCALRYFNVAGADPDGRSGQSTPKATHLIKVAIEAVVRARDHVTIFGTDYPTPDGTGVRDYIHVSDLAAAHLLALEALIAQPSRNLQLNCGYGRGFSVLEVLDAVERVSGKRIKRRLEARRAGDPAAVIADNHAIKTILGWQPRYDDLDTIIGHALAWERQNMANADLLPTNHYVSIDMQVATPAHKMASTPATTSFLGR